MKKVLLFLVILLAIGGVVATVQNDILTMSKEVFDRPPREITPPGDTYRPIPDVPKPDVPVLGTKKLENAVIEFVTGWTALEISKETPGDIRVAYINAAEEKVKVRISVFRHAQLAPVNTIDFTLEPHEAHALGIGIPATGDLGLVNYWVSIQATSPALIIQDVRFSAPGSAATNFGYEKIAALELPSGKRLW